jgi:hypothetical protein
MHSDDDSHHPEQPGHLWGVINLGNIIGRG